jgi:hypothetical protein
MLDKTQKKNIFLILLEKYTVNDIINYGILPKSTLYRRLKDLNGDLIDLNKHGFMFSTFEQHYREVVEEKINDLKND